MRDEFTKATKLAAWQACVGRCQDCTAKLFTGNIEYHHDTECTFGGTAKLHRPMPSLSFDDHPPARRSYRQIKPRPRQASWIAAVGKAIVCHE